MGTLGSRSTFSSRTVLSHSGTRSREFDRNSSRSRGTRQGVPMVVTAKNHPYRMKKRGPNCDAHKPFTALRAVWRKFLSNAGKDQLLVARRASTLNGMPGGFQRVRRGESFPSSPTLSTPQQRRKPLLTLNVKRMQATDERSRAYLIYRGNRLLHYRISGRGKLQRSSAPLFSTYALLRTRLLVPAAAVVNILVAERDGGCCVLPADAL